MTSNVIMFVYNSFTHDTRVLREAKSLVASGYSVSVIAFLDKDLEPYEEQEGVKIIRVIRDPIHLRFLKHIRELDVKILNFFGQGSSRPSTAHNSGSAALTSPGLSTAIAAGDAILTQAATDASSAPAAPSSPTSSLSPSLSTATIAARSASGLPNSDLPNIDETHPDPISNQVLSTEQTIHSVAAESDIAEAQPSLPNLPSTDALSTEQQESEQQESIAANLLHSKESEASQRFDASNIPPVAGRRDRLSKAWQGGQYGEAIAILADYLVYLGSKISRKISSTGSKVLKKVIYKFKALRKALGKKLGALGKKLTAFRKKAIARATMLYRKVARLWTQVIKAGDRKLKSIIRAISKFGKTLSKQVNRSILLATKKSLSAVKLFIYNLLKRILLPANKIFYLMDYYSRCIQAVRSMESTVSVCHAHDLNTLFLGYWVARKHGAKLVYDSHELALDRNRLRPYSWIENVFLTQLEGRLGRRADAVITVNQSIAEDMFQRHGLRAVPDVVMNTPPLQSLAIRDTDKKLAIRQTLNIPDHLYVLLYSGSITFNRGIERVIESLEYLTDCHLVLMGYGKDTYKDSLQALAVEKQVSDRFSFFGPVPSEDVPAYAMGADLGVAPIENVCLSYYYCSPNKLFEYVAAGLPAVASDFPEMRRVVMDHGIGSVFEPSDPKDIARAVREVLDHPEKREQMRQNTTSAASAYNWENESRKLIDLYRRIGDS